jgi:hypothetical protein
LLIAKSEINIAENNFIFLTIDENEKIQINKIKVENENEKSRSTAAINQDTNTDELKNNFMKSLFDPSVRSSSSNEPVDINSELSSAASSTLQIFNFLLHGSLPEEKYILQIDENKFEFNYETKLEIKQTNETGKQK